MMSGWVGARRGARWRSVHAVDRWCSACARARGPSNERDAGRGRSRFALPSARAVRAAGRVFLFLAVLRFVMPLIAIGNDWVYRTFLETRLRRGERRARAGARDARGARGRRVDSACPRSAEWWRGAATGPRTMVRSRVAKPFPRPGSRRGFSTARAALYQRRGRRRVDVQARLERYAVAAESVSENTIRLIVVFRDADGGVPAAVPVRAVGRAEADRARLNRAPPASAQTSTSRRAMSSVPNSSR